MDKKRESNVEKLAGIGVSAVWIIIGLVIAGWAVAIAALAFWRWG